MAIIDTERNVIVVRIVYDGPPLSGKTASVRALGNLLGTTPTVFSLEAETTGHQGLDFDWMEYKGGFFKGYSIFCQIISIPGHLSLNARHHFLLQTADAVVFVLDASSTNQATSLDYFKSLQQLVAVAGNHTIQAVIQANKQDQPQATTLPQLREIFCEYPQIRIVESIALSGKGVRESFVLAVRLAVEGAAIWMAKGQMRYGKPEINSGKELIKALQQLNDTERTETATLTELPPVEEELITPQVVAPDKTVDTDKAAATPKPVIDAELAVAPAATQRDNLPDKEIVTIDQPPLTKKSLTKQPVAKHLPQFPDENTPTQWIWPPIHGRSILNKVLKESLKPRLQHDQCWIIQANKQWYCFSKVEWQYPEADQARQALRTHLRLHLECSPILSEQRCVVVAINETKKAWRLWQIVPYELTLAEHLAKAWQYPYSPVQVAVETFRCASRYVDALQQCWHYPPTLNLTLDYVGVTTQSQLVYLGYIEGAAMDERRAWDTATLSEAIIQEFVSRIVKLLPPAENEVTEVVEELSKIDGFEQQYIVDALLQLLSEAK